MPAQDGRVAARASLVPGAVVTIVFALVVGVSCSGASNRVDRPASTTTTASTRTSVEPGQPRVDVFGDSLVVQAHDALRVEGEAHGLNMAVAAYYGLAPCDLLPAVRAELVRPLAAIVVAFSGNNITPCMKRGGHDLTGAAYYAAYRRDVSTMLAEATARNVPVVVVGPPRFSAAKNIPDRVALNEVYRQIAAKYPGTRYVASAPELSPDGFTTTLPCNPYESAALGCHAGRITVRGPDHIHFDAPRTVPCPTGHDSCSYSAGAHRFADVILAGLAPIAALHYTTAPAAVGVPIDVTQED